MRIYFATDVHGSETCWRKFLNAAAHYKADVLVLGVPSHVLRTTLEQVAPLVRPWIPILSLIKGLEQETQPAAVQSESVHPRGSKSKSPSAR